MWFVLSLFSAVTYSFRSLFEKKLLKNTDKYILAFGLRFFALPFFILALLFNSQQLVPLTDLPLKFWLATFYVSMISTPLEMIYFYKALQLAEVSYIVPLLSLAPVFTTIINFFVFKETPTFLGFAGIVLIVSAVYILNINQKGESFWQPFKSLYKNQAAKYAFIMMTFYSLSIIVDKIAITGAGTYFYAFWNYLLVSLVLLITMFIKARKKVIQVKTNFPSLLFLGSVVAGYTLLRFLALENGNAGYVSAVLGSSVFFSILFGLVIFKEKRVLAKIVSGFLVLLGLLLIKLYG